MKENIPTKEQMMKYPGVYLSGPYTSNPEENVKTALKIADWVLEHEGVPYVPHLSHYWEDYKHKPYRFWMDYDMVMLTTQHMILRFEGESSGADEELEEAKKWGMPIVLYKDIKGKEDFSFLKYYNEYFNME